MRLALATTLLLMMAAGCATPTVTVAPPTSGAIVAPQKTLGPTPMPSTLSSVMPLERIIGGLEVHERPTTMTPPSRTQEQALAIVVGEINAGRARMIGFGAGIPRLRVVEGAFVAGLTEVRNTQGGPVFESSEPTRAWVVVLDGVGADGKYVVVGVIDDSRGAALAVVVLTPGS